MERVTDHYGCENHMVADVYESPRLSISPDPMSAAKEQMEREAVLNHYLSVEVEARKEAVR